MTNYTDLLNSKITLKNGHSLYFVSEKVDQQNADFWNLYQCQATYMAGYLNGFCKSIEEAKPYPNEYSKVLNYNEDQYKKVIDYIKKKEFPKKGTFTGVKGGTNGMNQVISRWKWKDTKLFMIYASINPVTSRHIIDINQENISDLSDYKKRFGEIIMSFVFITQDNTPTVTHYGIFRNPLHFLEDTDEKYAGISMKLHGFAAETAQKSFTGKKYMITQPMPSMGNIMTKYLGEGNIFIGTNQDLKSKNKSDEDKILLKNFPPIYHETGSGIHKIAFPGTDLTQYLDSLPDEKAEFIAQEGAHFDLSGWTLGAMKTVIKLDKLAEFYFSDK